MKLFKANLLLFTAAFSIMSCNSDKETHKVVMGYDSFYNILCESPRVHECTDNLLYQLPPKPPCKITWLKSEDYWYGKKAETCTFYFDSLDEMRNSLKLLNFTVLITRLGTTGSNTSVLFSKFTAPNAPEDRRIGRNFIATSSTSTRAGSRLIITINSTCDPSYYAANCSKNSVLEPNDLGWRSSLPKQTTNSNIILIIRPIIVIVFCALSLVIVIVRQRKSFKTVSPRLKQTNSKVTYDQNTYATQSEVENAASTSHEIYIDPVHDDPDKVSATLSKHGLTIDESP